MEKDAPSGKDGHADRPRAIAEDSAPDVRPDALLAALAAMDRQMNCEEQQGKEHPV